MARTRIGESRRRITPKRAVALVAAGLFVAGSVEQDRFDLLGDMGHNRTGSEMLAVAQSRIDHDFAVGSETDRFAMMYLAEDPGSSYDRINVGSRVETAGLLRVFGNMAAIDKEFLFGQDCLVGSAYDTRPSEIRGRRVSGDISAVAGLNVVGNTVVVYSATTGPEPLRFEQTADGRFRADDEATVATLEAYGCDPVVTKPPVYEYDPYA